MSYFFQKKHRLLIPIAVFSVILIIIAAVILLRSGNKSRPYVSVTQLKNPQILVKECVQDYMTDGEVLPIYDYINANEVTDRLDVSIPVTIKYTVNNINEGVEVDSAELILSESRNLEKSAIYKFDTDAIAVNNLKVGTHYYYKVNIYLTDDSILSCDGDFYTSLTPRIITLDGAVNVRDIGGWKTTSGKTVKQGVIIRGSEIDGLIEPSYKLSDKGKKQFEALVIKLDADLRYDNEVKALESGAGKSIKHVVYGVEPYKLYSLSETNEPMRRVFSSLADKNNYPIYLHCTYGIDRTGTVCYVLEALLGVPEEMLLREYELSTLTYQGNNARAQDSAIRSYINELKTFEGNSMQDKAENYLLSIGVSKEEIDSIKNILLE